MRLKISYKHLIYTFSLVRVYIGKMAKISQNILGKLVAYCLFTYVNKIAFAASFAIKKVNTNEVFSKRISFFMNFHQMRQPLRNTQAKH